MGKKTEFGKKIIENCKKNRFHWGNKQKVLGSNFELVAYCAAQVFWLQMKLSGATAVKQTTKLCSAKLKQ